MSATPLRDVKWFTERLGIARATVYRWKAADRLPPCIKLGGRELRFRESVVEAWLDMGEEIGRLPTRAEFLRRRKRAK